MGHFSNRLLTERAQRLARFRKNHITWKNSSPNIVSEIAPFGASIECRSHPAKYRVLKRRIQDSAARLSIRCGAAIRLPGTYRITRETWNTRICHNIVGFVDHRVSRNVNPGPMQPRGRLGKNYWESFRHAVKVVKEEVSFRERLQSDDVTGIRAG